MEPASGMLDIEGNDQLVIQDISSNEADLSEEGPILDEVHSILQSFEFASIVNAIKLTVVNGIVTERKNYKSLTDVIQ